MNISRIFILRPIATLLLSIALTVVGAVSFRFLPVAPIPTVDMPVIFVQASLAGASPETMAATVATPLERAMGQIAGITELTSVSSQGSTHVIIQFDMSRDVDGAARDVQAAINAARSLLPSAMKTLPTYHKANPSSAPIMMLAMTSDRLSRGQLYDLASSKLQQRIAQVQGVGQVSIRGGALPAVRIDLKPRLLESYGIPLDTVRKAVDSATSNSPRGLLSGKASTWWIEANGQLTQASQYRDLIVTYRNGVPVRLKDVANVYDSIQDKYSSGYFNSKPSVSISITRQAGANMLETIDSVKALMPELNSMLPAGTKLTLAIDRSSTVRDALQETEKTLLFSILLVIVVVYVFLRRGRATLIPAVALPISLVGTFSAMYFLGYSLDALSMMALIICTGFVVDDAIVVVENISRHIEEGMIPMQAALKGSHEIGFTILSMTSSLIAVFIPLLFMGGIVGKLFREFAVTLSVALAISMFVSLTLTPMLCSRLFRKDAPKPHRMPNGRRWPQTVVLDWISSGLRKLHTAYVASLGTVMKHKLLTMVILLLTIVGNVFLYITIDKGLFPDQDTGILFGMVRADQQTSFTQMDPKILRLSKMLEKDPAIEYVLASTGGGGFGSRNTGQFFIRLKPLDQRTETASQVANRLFALSKRMPGTSLFLMPVQDFRTGGRSANATYQYSIQSDDLTTLRKWSSPIYKALSKLPELTSVDSDAETGGSEVKVIVDREAATRYGLNAREIDTFLNDAFAQRQIATQYKMLNQYYSVIGLDSSWTQDPSVLTRLFVVTSAGKQIPVSNFAHIEYSTTPLSVDHEDQTATTTIAFNLADGVSLDTAKAAIDRTMASLGLPDSVHGSFAGTAATFQKTMGQIPILILTAILVIYILLGILYESWIHPITILSTLPSAGIGALLLMEITGTQFTVIAFIGILLLIGIVKKNAILMVDFAIAAEREGRTPEEAIIEACRKRFRPILMTSCAAFFGAVPLLLQTGSNASFHRPLGIAICGGLLVSQVLTLYTTPVVYVYLDRFGSWAKQLWRRFFKGNGTATAVTAGK